MCDQTEIKYEDEEVVWVKLGACWWPGQVQGYEKLPEDLKIEFDKKGLIAAVKFFQEDKFELVRNLQQIYKYNCKKKDEFLKKGYDKYRSKTKEGSGWMAKFPDDVATAERLTNGDPDILSAPKFSPEEKPDISYLFGGDKKPPKKKKDKEDRKSYGTSPQRKITHPRFRGSSDHEVRIRTNQYSGSSQPSTPDNTNVRNYDCPVCSFTSTRVNVLISHARSHKSSGYESPLSRPRASLPPKASRTHSLESPKRKYVRKTKSMSAKAASNDKSPSESAKRKYSKNVDNKIVKKKKTDPELREKLLADWDIGSSDEDVDAKESFGSPKDDTLNSSENNKEDLLSETEKLLKDTQNNLSTEDDEAKNKENNLIKKLDEKDNKNQSQDEKSKFSCFDFDEDEPEPPVTIPVRKLGRVFGEKTSLKKEIIKEFNKSQELENKRDEMNKLNDDNKLLEEMNKEADDIDNLVAKISKTTSLNSPKNKKLEEENEISFKSGTSDTLILSSRSESDLKSEASGLSEGPELLLGAVASESENLSKRDQDQETPIKNQETPMQDQETSIQNQKTPMEDQETPMEVDNKEEELEILEIIETEEIEVPPKNSPELEKKSKAMEYSDLDRVTIEEEETLPLRATSGPKSGNLCMGWSQLNEIIGSSLDKNNQAPTPVKRGRGRPPKPKPVNSLIKDEAPKTPDYERKTSESDTERSYSGRRRKPNKKYLEDAYSSPSSSGFAGKTDDSQSEAEEKKSEVVVVKKKRGRPLGWKKNKNNKVFQVREPVEFEMSDQTLDSAEEITETVEIKERVIDPVESRQEIPENLEEDKGEKSPVHLINLTSAIEIRTPAVEIPLADNNSVQVEIDIEDQIGPGAPEATPVDDYSQTQDQVDRAALMNDLEDKDDDNCGSLHERIDILPPKKSQIKKFELSQIDESQIDLENEIKKHVDVEQGILEVDEKPKNEMDEEEEEEEDHTDVITETFEIIEDKTDDNFDQDDGIIDKEQVGEEIEEEREKIDKVDEEMDKIEEEREKIDKVEEEMDKIEEEREKIEEVINKVEEETEKIDKIEEEINKIDKIEEEREKIDKIEEEIEKIEKFEEEITKIEKDREKIDKIEEEIEKIEEIEKFEKEITKIEGKIEKIDKMEKEIEKIEEEREKIEEEIEKINKIEDEAMETIETVETIETIETIVTSELTEKSSELIENNSEKLNEDSEKLLIENSENLIENSELKNEPVKLTEEIINSEIEKPVEIPEENTTINSLEADKGLELLNQAMESVEAGEPAPESIKSSEEPVSNMELKATEVPEEELKPTEVPEEELKPTTLIEESATDSSEIIDTPEEPTQPEVPAVDQEPEKIVKLVSSPVTDELESTIPVKKREKPRIIENVQLKEPMHILKSKLLEKPKGKHKLDDHRLGSKAKIIKLDPSIKRSKGGMSYGQKLQVLKAADANDKLQIGQLPSVNQLETVATISIAEGQKLIQSSNLEDMELDINSMPFVLSEDLTPDSFEQMPVVISSIMPTSSGMRAAPQSLPRAAPALAPITSDIETITVDASPKKKVSPAILKTKPKAKPTITSIKTLSSPVGGIKSLKFQNTKTSPVVSQKNTPSKYVIVQAEAGGQQMRYMIQGKPTAKVAKVSSVSPGNKPATNPQIVSQGGKVVILTSPQSGQAKMVPLKNSLIKGHVGKMTKVDSPTTSKASPKIISSSLLGNKSTGSPKTILNPMMKPGVYTPVNPKILNQKTFKPGTIIAGTSKTIIPMPGKITGVVPGKGTVLTPITGQQVKAIAAKSPGKPNPTKVTYQLQKGLPMVAKIQKIQPISRSAEQPISPAGSPVRNLKPTGIVMTQKTPVSSKKIIRPAGTPGIPSLVSGVSDKMVKLPRGRGRTKPEIKPPVKSLPKIKSKEFTGQQAPGQQAQASPGPSVNPMPPGLIPTPGPSALASEHQEVAPEIKEEKAAPQIMALPTESSDGTQTYVLVTIDDQGQIQPLDNNTLMSLEGTIQNPDGTRTLYIDPASLGESNLDNIVLQFDNSVAPAPAVASSSSSSSSDFSRQVPTTNQDILAAALANTDFQQEILPETTVASLTAGLTATSLINQTILQSTIIPTSEPISSPSVLETSLTLNQPIMTPLEVPTSLPIQVEAAVSHSAPTSLELPITITNPGIAYIQSELPGNSMPDIGEVEAPAVSSADNYLVLPSISEGQTVSYTVSMTENISIDSTAPTPSMPIIDDGFSDDVKAQGQSQAFREAGQDQNVEVRDMPIVADETSMEVDRVESEVQAPVSESQEEVQQVQEQIPEVCELGTVEAAGENAVQEQVQEIQESLDNQAQGEFQQDIQVQEINQQINYKPESRDEPMEVEESEPSQSYEPSTEIPTQSKSQSTEASPVAYEEAMVEESEPPTQSYDDVKAEATQSYNAPTQSFSEDQARIDDPDFPTQSYEVEKPDNVDGDGIIETDGELSQEGNIPSQSNDIDGIGTSFMGDDRNSCNMAGTASGTGASFNEDETASSSYVPETPETQERDQDQESAISTSSYEIPTCEEINIASSSVIPDTSVDAEHTSIHNNGVPEIPTSSYNLNPDSSSGGSIDAVPSSSYEDNQVEGVVEQNVSTSYQVPISMPGLEGNAGFVSESTDQADQPTSYYARHTEDTSEATQSYFVPEGPSPSYQPQTASPSYYEPPPESEATQSYYSQDLEQRTADVEQSASQSYYQESTTSSSSGSTLTSSSATTTAAATTTNDEELRLGQVGEATPTYSTERYPVDYNIDNSSPIDRHDLVESSVSATPQPTER